MKVVTFGGNFCYFPMMSYDMVFVDDSYNQCYERVKHPHIIHLRSGVSDNNWESRRYRIAYMIREITSMMNDDLFLVDSDVFIPVSQQVFPTSFCIPARAKPGNDIMLFCRSTNVYIPVQLLKTVHDIMNYYIENKLYKTYFVDIYLHTYVPFLQKVIPGTCHWVLGKKYCISDGYNIVQTF